MATTMRSRTSRVSSKRLAEARSKIQPAGESFEHLKALFYGRNGMGKTRMGASGPKAIVIDCNEKGTLSIRNFEETQVFKVELWSDINDIYWFLKVGKHDRETVVIDTVTSLASLCMRFVLGDEASRDPTKDPNMPSKREWGKVGELMRTVILNFRNLPMNVVFLAQERRGFSEDDEEAPETFPEVSPSVRSTLTAGVDIIGRMYLREVVQKAEKGTKKAQAVTEYRMLIGPHERYLTKDRSEAGLPPVLRLGKRGDQNHDTLTKLIDRIKKGAA